MEEKIKELEDKNKELEDKKKELYEIVTILNKDMYFKLQEQIEELREVIKESHKEISRLKSENESISETLYQTRLHLKKYTSPASSKKYYEKNKEECLRKGKEYKERINYKTSKEKTKEYNRNAYLRRKILDNALAEEEQEG